jgi:CCR4-NOT transcription complex subunit 9
VTRCYVGGFELGMFSPRLPMAGLLSPKPVSYLQQGNGQFNTYGRGLSNFSETPPLSGGTSAQGHHQLPQAYPNGNGTHNNAGLHEDGKIYGLVIELMDPNTREGALLELSKKREQYDDLALVLWHSFGMSRRSKAAGPPA